MPTSKLFPDPVCTLPDEYGLVAAVLAAPPDDLPKLVYADWLEERGDPRGEFLRAWLAARKGGKKLPDPFKGLSKCWLSAVGYTLDAWLVRHGNPAWGDDIRATAEPCLVVRSIPLKDGETVPTGRSKMGGLPDLDPEVPWPMAEYDPEGNEMGFVAQWNLAELAVSPCAAKLPKQGLLSFFIDLVPFVEDSRDGTFEVMFAKNAAAVEEQEPSDLWEDNDLPACRVEFREWLSVPDHRSPALKSRLTARQKVDYMLPYFDYPMPKGAHRILGHAGPIQDHPSPAGKKPWSLLTEFGPDADLRLEACDGGTWYFMTPAADLAKGKFGKAHMEFQTG